MGFSYYCPGQEAHLSSIHVEIARGVKNRRQDKMRGDYLRQKGNQNVETLECEWWSLYKTAASVRSYLRKDFPYEYPLSEECLLREKYDEKLSGYVQCDVEVAQHLRRYFLKPTLIFQNTVVSVENIGTLMKEYAEENIMVQPGKTLIIKLPFNQWNADDTFTYVFLEGWAGVQVISSVTSKHFQEKFQHFRTVCRENTTLWR